ncbi:C40 family peptidase [Flavobacterium aciduliphilum]|nr:LysM peptidoglycan-binding domain-containing protein [Flavobacterium aciduliphilum]
MMKVFKIVSLLALVFSVQVQAQKIIKHKIKSGESIYGLALKYDLTEKEIYAVNPKTKGALLQLGQVVNIPNKKYKEKSKPSKKTLLASKVSDKDNGKKETLVENKFIKHTVTAKETLYSIAKKYGVTMEVLCEMNPELKTSNLKKGAVLKIPNQEIVKEQSNQQSVENEEKVVVKDTFSNELIHTVAPKETLFRISKQYGVSVEDIKKWNPEIDKELPIGYALKIKKTTVQGNENTSEDSVVTEDIPAGNLSKAEFLIEKAFRFLGTRYRRGGDTGAGFDCSGLMFHTFKNINMFLPRSSHEMANIGVKIDKAHAQKGDLIFFATFGGRRVSHVGMITEVLDDEIKFIHSATNSGVIVSSTKEPYYVRTFVQINRVISQ